MTTFFYKSSIKGVIRVQGEDAQDYLQSQWTIDLRKLPSGGIRYGLRLSTKGKVLADSYFIRIGEEEFILLSKDCEASHLLALLEENIVADEVEFSDETKKLGFTLLWQEKQIPNFQLEELTIPEKNQFAEVENGFFFEDFRAFSGAFSLLLPKNSTWSKPSEWSEQKKSKFETQRIQAGQVSVPIEIGPEDLPQEGKLEKDAVDFDKGCYLGQEVMARIHAMGRVRRQACSVYGVGSQFPVLLPYTIRWKESGNTQEPDSNSRGKSHWVCSDS